MKRSFSERYHLLKLFLVEEYRRHLRYVSPISFYLFPFYIALFTFLAVKVGISDIVLSYGAFFYGISVGAFGYLGIQYLRKRLREFLLINLPEILPISYKETFLYLYLRDLIYYSLLMGISVVSVLLAFSKYQTIMLILIMFILGYSSSYAISIAYLRNPLMAGLLVIPLIPVIVPLLPNIIFLKIVLAIAYTIAGFFLTPEEIKIPVYTSHTKSSYIGDKNPLVKKTFLDVWRSGMPIKLIFGYLLPLTLIILFSDYISTTLVNLRINSVGYASIFGFLTLVIYSWLTMVDDHSYLTLLPVKPFELIKSFFIVYLIISLCIIVPAVVAISFAYGEIYYMPISLLVGIATSIYGFWCLARFTGLHTTSLLFDPSVMVKFSAAVIPPNMLVLAHSVMIKIPMSPYIIAFALSVMTAVTYLNYRKVRKTENFEF